MQTTPTGQTGVSGGEDRQLVAMYETYDRARSARDELTAAGIPASDIDILDAKEGGWRSSGTEPRDEGFWGAIKRMFMPEEQETHSYAEGLRRGNSMLVVRPAVDMHARAVDVLERTEPLDFDARVSEWRSEGWTGRFDEGATWSGRDDAAPMGAPAPAVSSTSGAATGTTGALGTTGMAAAGSAAGTAETGTAGTGTTGAGRSGPVEQRIPLAEERLRVGKREVGSGDVRVRSYVVERPVEEQVRLHQESVHVDRRPVDRPVSGSDDPFRERTVEVSARSEEAVIGKEAQVREEVVIRKDATDREEKVKDTVRRTEVEVDENKGRGTETAQRAASRPSDQAATPEKGTVKP
jgi:uncharacterized protein (TIGR02271 family)